MRILNYLKRRPRLAAALCGGAAGVANGMLGAGGGMLLVPLLRRLCISDDRKLFATAVAVMLPVSLVSFLICLLRGNVAFLSALPYCIGGLIGGLLGGLFYKKIPTTWLHRALGIFILWGGIRLLL